MLQEAVAERSGTTASYICEIESGNANPALQATSKWALGLDVEVYELFVCEDDKRTQDADISRTVAYRADFLRRISE